VTVRSWLATLPASQAARSELGYDSDNDAEWRVQIVQARRDLIEDTPWRGLLSQAVQKSNYYCNFLLQESQQPLPRATITTPGSSALATPTTLKTWTALSGKAWNR